jgi:hypothetical protein
MSLRAGLRAEAACPRKKEIRFAAGTVVVGAIKLIGAGCTRKMAEIIERVVKLDDFVRHSINEPDLL